MATQKKALKGTLHIAAALTVVLAVMGGVFGFAQQAQADFVAPTTDNIADPNYLFDTGLKLDPNADTSGFTVRILKDGQEIEPPTGIHDIPADAPEAWWPYRDKTEWETGHYGFFRDASGRKPASVSFWFDDPTALDDAVIEITYPYIGTYNGEPVGMQAIVSNIEFRRHPFSAAATHVENNFSWTLENGKIVGVPEGSKANTYVTGPAMHIAKLPQYGIFQWNIHQDDFDVKFYKSTADYQSIEGGAIAEMDDLFMTYNSLSVYRSTIGSGHPNYGGYQGWPGGWNSSAYFQHERVKALSKVNNAFVVDGTNVYTSGDAGEHGLNDRYETMLNYTEFTDPATGKKYWPQVGTIHVGGDRADHGYTATEDADAPWPYYWTTSENGFQDTMGADGFTRNSVSLNFASSLDVRFRMNTPDNSFWFSIYPMALTNSVPGKPAISADSASWKGVYATAEEAAAQSGEASTVKVGDVVTYKVDQKVNALGQDGSTRYKAMKIQALLPDGVTIDEGSLVIERSKTYNEMLAGDESALVALDASAGSFSVEGNTVSFTFDANYLAKTMPMQGEHYYLTVKGTVDKGAENKELSASAKTVINFPENEDPANTAASNPGRALASEQDVVLRVLDGEGEASNLKLKNRDDVFSFSVSQVVPADAVTIEFEDTLVDELEAVKAAIYTSDGQLAEVAGYVGTKIDGQKVTAFVLDNTAADAPLAEKYATALRGKNITLVIDAKVKDSVSDATLIEKYGNAMAITNEATVKMNGNPKVTNKVTVTPPHKPEKFVNGKKELVKLADRAEVFTYTIKQAIPEGAKKVEFEDVLERVLVVKEGDVSIDVDGATIKVQGQKVTATIADASKLVGQTVTLTIKAHLSTKVTDAELIELYGEDRNIPNTATVRINDDPRVTNEVLVTPPPEPRDDPEKFINGSKVPLLLQARDEVFTYTVSQKIPSTATSASFADTLKDELEFAGTNANAKLLVGADKKEIPASAYTLEVEGQTITASFADVKAYRGETVVLSFDARIKEGVTDEQLVKNYGDDKQIPNKATVRIDDDPQTTNEVKVNPPANDPEKKINDQKEPVTLLNRNEVFTYTVSQDIPAGAANVEFTDTLERVLVITSTSFAIEGVDAANTPVPVVDGQTVTATIANATQMAGKTATLTITAVIKDGVSDAELIRLYGEERQIPNKATVAINGNGKATNEVLVTPPDEKGEDPVKTVNGGTSLVKLQTRPEFFEYAITQKIPATATKIVFSDTLVDELQFTGTDQKIDASINADGATIEINGQTITATLEGDAAKNVREQLITLKFKAKVKDSVTDEELVKKYPASETSGERNIPNTGSVAINDKPAVETNTVYVVPPARPGDDPEKFVNGSKGLVELENRYSEFVYTVTQKIPAAANTASFTDTLVDVLEITKAEIDSADFQVAVDGQTVTANAADVRASRGKVVTLTIWAKIKEGVSDLDLVATYGDDKKIPNKATVVIDDDPKTTNEVLVTPPDDPTPDPQKKINGGTAKVELGNRNDSFVYTVSQEVPATATKIEITDQLEHVLQVVGTPSADMNGATVEVTQTEAGPLVTLVAEGNAVKAVRGQTVTLTINAKISDAYDELYLVNCYGDAKEIPNKATVAINDDPKTTNEVLVTPPDEQTPDPVKKINGGFELVELENRSDDFVYTVEQLVPATAKTLTFEDVLEGVLEVKEASIDVDPALVVSEFAGNTVKVTVTDATAYRGQTVTLTIRAKIMDGISDQQLIEAGYGDEMIIPNRATVTINDTAKVTNTVEVTPPPEKRNDPVKAINGQTDPVVLANRGDEFVYTITQLMPANATSAAFEDELQPELEIVIDKTTITGAADYQIQVDGQKVTAFTSDARPDRNQEVTLTIVAKFRDTVSDADLVKKYGDARQVPNVATVSVNGTPKFTNEVLVTPPEEPREDPVKQVNGAESADLTNRSEVFTYTVEQLVPATAATATFEDVLEDVLEITGASILGSSKYDIAVDGQTVVAYTSDATLDRNRKVVLTITAKIRDNVSDEDLIARFGSTTVPNKAIVTIDGDPRTTNTVTVTPPPVVEEEPVKKVNGRDHVDLQSQTEIFTYSVKAMVPADATKFVITDTLEPVLAFAAGTVYADKAGCDIAIDGQTITVTYEGEAAIALRGKEVTLSFNAQLREDADLSAYENRTVPNKATYTVNDDPGRTHETNTVTVTPPESPKDHSIIKAVNGMEHANLADANEVFNYTLTLAVPADATKLVITDTLVPELEFAVAAEDVQVSVGGSGVTKEINGQTVTVTIDGITEEAGLRGGTVIVGFQAKIRAGADLSAYGNKVPNAGSYMINDDPNRSYESNVVTVTPPEPTGNVDVVYLTTDGQILKATEIVLSEAPIGTAYNTNQLEFAGYRFVSLDTASDPVTGTVEEGWKHVIYLYEPIPPEEPVVYGYVDVVHVTTDGYILKGVDMVAEREPVGTEYTTSQGEFPGYNFVYMGEQSADPSGLVEEGIKHVIYVYEPIPKPVGNVDVTYVTTDGKVLKETSVIVKDGEVGSPYSTTLLNFEGYSFVYMDEQSADPAGLVEEGTKHVIYVYQPNPDPVGNVDVTYVTTDGTVLKATTPVAENEKVDTPYATEQLEFDGYTFKQMDPDSAPAAGQVKEGTQHVIYVYEPVVPDTPTGNVDVTYVTTDGTVLKATTPVAENEKVNTPYDTEQLKFDGYTFKQMDPDSAPAAGLVKEGTQHVIYVYEPVAPPTTPVGSVDVTYVTSDGKVLKETTWAVENGEVGTPYSTDQLEFEGYTFTKMDPASADPSGTVEEGTKHVIYVYDPDEEIDTDKREDPKDTPKTDEEEKTTPTTPSNTPTTPTTPTTTTTTTTPKTVTATPSTGTPVASTPVASAPASTVKGLATKTFDEYGGLIVALGALAVAAFGIGAFALRRRSAEK